MINKCIYLQRKAIYSKPVHVNASISSYAADDVLGWRSGDTKR